MFVGCCDARMATKSRATNQRPRVVHDIEIYLKLEPKKKKPDDRMRASETAVRNEAFLFVQKKNMKNYTYERNK